MCWPEELLTKRSLHRCYKPLTNGQRDSELASLTVLAIVVDTTESRHRSHSILPATAAPMQTAPRSSQTPDT